MSLESLSLADGSLLGSRYHFVRLSSARSENTHRNGISYLQAAVVGLGQACAVAPGLSRSGTTIATGLICGVRRDVMAQFSFLMVLVPIIGEQALTIIKGIGETAAAPGVGFLPLLMGFIGAFGAGLFACKVMVELVKRAKLVWFSIYCLLAAFVILIFA